MTYKTANTKLPVRVATDQEIRGGNALRVQAVTGGPGPISGPAMAIVVLGENDIETLGGGYKLSGNAPLQVELTTDRGFWGGNAIPIYPVDANGDYDPSFIPSPPVGPLVYDTFTDANGTALNVHTPDVDSVGGGWSYAQGTLFTINSNQLDIGPEQCLAIIDAGNPDVKITGTFTIPGDDQPNIWPRYMDVGNHVRCVFDYIPVGSMAMLEFVGGGPNLIANQVTGIFGARTFDFEITVVGNAITMTDLTNAKQIAGTMNAALAGNTVVGIGDQAGETGPIVLDDFRIIEQP